MNFLFQILAAIALLVVVAEASPTYVGVKRMTNADRMKRGLGPAPPVFKRVVPGRRSNLPTRAFVAKRGSPSPSAVPPAPTKHIGRIEVRNTTGFTYGFVQNTVSGPSGVTLNSTIDPLAVSFSTSQGSSGPFDITATNATFSAPLTLGGVGNASLAADSASAVVFNSTAATSPSAAFVSGATGESAIWTLDGRTAQISANWINADKSKPTTFIGLDTVNNVILLTGNITLYNQAASSPLTEVKFFLASPPFQ
ncbi:hypothetical protein EIP91_003198 [Steccherinum ochraceum]|uniref:Uncharacterized protein n=1 Tax=Steccherinum ochraceum TaxID=92696 RepID=A0A4R0RXS3_9APHY|nr:hypothetical protein EIP91_003198 [Steccherinum ochraceum]